MDSFYILGDCDTSQIHDKISETLTVIEDFRIDSFLKMRHYEEDNLMMQELINAIGN